MEQQSDDLVTIIFSFYKFFFSLRNVQLRVHLYFFIASSSHVFLIMQHSIPWNEWLYGGLRFIFKPVISSYNSSWYWIYDLRLCNCWCSWQMIPCLPEFWAAWKGAHYVRTSSADFVNFKRRRVRRQHWFCFFKQFPWQTCDKGKLNISLRASYWFHCVKHGYQPILATA